MTGTLPVSTGLVGLGPIWQRCRERIAHLGRVGGTVALDGLDAQTRDALADLLGSRVPLTDGDRVPLARIDAALARSRHATELLTVVEAMCGPVPDMPGERAAKKRTWEAGMAQAHAHRTLQAHPELECWLDEVTRSGLLRRVAGDDPGPLLTSVLDVVGALPLDPVRPLPEAATLLVGASHALDHGTPHGTLVLRAIAALHGEAPPTNAEARRSLWERVGVVCDDLSCDVLVLNVPWPDRSLVARTLTAHAAAGEPLRLTLRQVNTLREQTPGTLAEVFVAENPAVLSAASTAHGPDAAAMVCTSGMPTTAALRLLNRLRDSGTAIRYHGDFDWAGIRIANTVHEAVGFVPWRFGTSDYCSAVTDRSSRIPLSGNPVEAVWDAQLAETMAQAGCALEEEEVLSVLLADVGPGSLEV